MIEKIKFIKPQSPEGIIDEAYLKGEGADIIELSLEKLCKSTRIESQITIDFSCRAEIERIEKIKSIIEYKNEIECPVLYAINCSNIDSFKETLLIADGRHRFWVFKNKFGLKSVVCYIPNCQKELFSKTYGLGQ